MTTRNVLAGAASTLGLLAVAIAAGPQQPGPGPAPPAKAESPPVANLPAKQVLLEELRSQAREDLAIWEARVAARKSWVVEADKLRAITRAFRDFNEKQVHQGILPPNELNQLSVQTAEMEVRLNQKKLELVEAEAKAVRLRRRVALMGKADKYDLLRPPFAGLLGLGGTADDEDRLGDLEKQLARLRAELDAALTASRFLTKKSRDEERKK